MTCMISVVIQDLLVTVAHASMLQDALARHLTVNIGSHELNALTLLLPLLLHFLYFCYCC